MTSLLFSDRDIKYLRCCNGHGHPFCLPPGPTGFCSGDLWEHCSPWLGDGVCVGESGMADSNKSSCDSALGPRDSIGIQTRSPSAECKGLSVILDMGWIWSDHGECGQRCQMLITGEGWLSWLDEFWEATLEIPYSPFSPIPGVEVHGITVTN